MSDRFPHVREPSSGEPDICIYCREEWVDLLTLYERDECSVRLRAEVDRLRSQVAALLAKVERLRDTVAFLRACVPPTHPSDYGHEAWAETVRTAVDAERAAVVSALERWAEDGGDPWMSFCADRIKSGEHRREEE